MTRAPAAALALLAGIGGAGCAERAAAPTDAAVGFGAALERGDYAAAYALTSSETRRRLPYPAFAALLATDPAEVKAFGHRLMAESGRTTPRTEISAGSGDVVPLVFEDGRWRIADLGFEPWGQSTPRAALRTFVRALEVRRYEVVLRLVPNRYRSQLSADKLRQYWEQQRKDDHAALLARLRAAAGAPIVETGDEAHMPYGPDQEARFIREDGLWKIESPE